LALKSTFGANQVTVEIGERLDTLGKQLDRLKAMYEQYFMGILKVAPAQLHRDVERTIRELTQLQIRNTGLRYRFTTLSQKYGSYNTYWKRILRDIENGRYVRDVRRASQRAMASGMDIPPELLAKLPKRLKDRILRDREQLAKRAEREGVVEAEEAAEAPADEPAVVRQPKPPGNVHTISADDMALLDGDDVDFDSLFGAIMKDDEPAPAKPAARPARKPAARPAPAPSPAAARKPAVRPAPAPSPAAARKPAAAATKPPPPGMTERQSRDLYKRYVQARKLVGERTDNLSYDKLMSTLNKQAPKIMQQHRARGVEFNVVVKGDKVVLKAKPKR